MGFPNDLLFYASYDSSLNAEYSKYGNIIPTKPAGTPTIDATANCGAGSLKSNSSQYLQYSGGAEMATEGCISFYFNRNDNAFKIVDAVRVFGSSGNPLRNKVWITTNSLFTANYRFTVAIEDSSGVNKVTQATGYDYTSGWHHVKLNFDSSVCFVKLYVDGSLVIDHSTSPFTRTNPAGVWVGNLNNNSLVSYADDVHLYNATQDFGVGCIAFGASFPTGQGVFGGVFGGGNVNGVTGGGGNASAGLGGRGGGGILQTIYRNEPVAARRRIYFKLVDESDGTTLETGEAGGQPEISVNGGDYAETENTLVAIDSGAKGTYYVELSDDEVNNEGSILCQYKSANTAEFEDVVFIRDKNDNPLLKQLRTIVQNTLKYTLGTSRNVNNLSQRLNVDAGANQQQIEITQD